MSAGDDLVAWLTTTVDAWLVQVCETARPPAVAMVANGTPVVTGYLRDQLDSDGSGGGGAYTAEFHSRADYSSFVDLGRGEVVPVRARALHFVVGGKDVFVMRSGPSEPRDFFESQVAPHYSEALFDAMLSLPIGGFA